MTMKLNKSLPRPYFLIAYPLALEDIKLISFLGLVCFPLPILEHTENIQIRHTVNTFLKSIKKK